MNYADTTIIIPSKDEPAVSTLVKGVFRTLPSSKVIVIYKGKRPVMPKRSGLSVVQQKGSGYGSALREGFGMARTKIVGMIDADGSYSPMDLKKVIGLVRNGYDMVLGNRLVRENANAMPRYIRFGNYAASITFDILHNMRIGDTQCGLRAMRRRMLTSLKLGENGWLFPPELNAKAANNNFRITDTPISYSSREGSSKLENKALYGFRLFAKTIAFRFTK